MDENKNGNHKIMEKEKTCVICKKKFSGYGNNPAPVEDFGVCCDDCNLGVIIPRRLIEWQ